MPESNAYHWFHILLQVISGTLCVYWYFRLPGPNKALLILAGMVALMMLYDMQPWQKAIYVLLVIFLIIIENRAINRDRSDAATLEAKRREAQNTQFQTIANGIQTAITDSNNQFNATMKRSDSILKSSEEAVKSSRDAVRTTQETLAYATGGDTFCYLDVIGAQNPLSIVSLRKVGPYPLYDVKINLNVMSPPPNDAGGQRIGGSQRFDIGNIPADTHLTVRDFSVRQFGLDGKSIVDINVAFEAKNGIWHELMYLRRVKGPPLEPLPKSGPFANAIDGRDPNNWKWLKAIRVYKIDYGDRLGGQAKSTQIWEAIDDQFPLSETTWNDWLLYDPVH